MTNFNELTERLNHLFDEESDRQSMSPTKARNRRLQAIQEKLIGIKNGDTNKLAKVIQDELWSYYVNDTKRFKKFDMNIEDNILTLDIGDCKYKITVEKV